MQMIIDRKNRRIICFGVSLLLVLPMLPMSPADNPPSCDFSLKWSINLDNYYPIGWGPGADDYCYQSNVPPVTADVTGDGWQEIFVCIGYDHDIRDPPQLEDEGTVYALNPQTGIPFWWYHCDDFGSHTCLALHDLDGDGNLELLATGYHNITAFHAENGTILWNKNYPNNREDKPSLVIRKNGTIWVYTCQNRAFTNQKTIQKRWGRNGTIAKEAPYPGPIHPCHGGLAAADMNNDGALEILCADRNSGQSGLGLSCWDTDLNLLWYHNEIACSTQVPTLLDVNNDGYLDAVIMNQAGSNSGICVANGKNGTHMTGKWSLYSGLPSHYTPVVYDIDQDGRSELIIAEEGQYNGWAKVFDLGLWQLEATLKRYDNSLYGLCKAPVIANVYGDEDMEMVFCTHAGWQLINGTHGNYHTIASQDDGYDGRADRIVIQDIDNDGKNEIVALMHGTGYGYGSYNFVRCYDTNGDASSPRASSKDFLYNYRRLAVAEYIPSYDPENVPENWTLNISVPDGHGNVTKNPDPDYYHTGDIVTLHAIADPNWVFDHWSGDLSGKNNPLDFTINGNTTIMAYFAYDNLPPDNPRLPSGPVSGKTGITYNYTTNTTDPDDDQVYYQWDWGDGNISDWLGPAVSGEIATAQHTWTTQGSYQIKVKAKDNLGLESDWSPSLLITMPLDLRSQQSTQIILLRLIKNSAMR